MNVNLPRGNLRYSLLILTLLLVGLEPLLGSNVGRRYPSEKTSYTDPQTGVVVTVLTTSPANDSRIYQTHPQWTYDQKYIVFRSDRASMEVEHGRRSQQAFAVNEITGEIIQLTDEPGTNPGSINLSRKENKMWYLKREEDGSIALVEMDLEQLFQDSEAGVSTQKKQTDYERVITRFPEGLSPSGGFGVDADETAAYLGVNRDDAPIQVSAPEGQEWRIKQTPGGLRKVDLKSGEWSMVIDTPFKMGHVQTNPWVPGEIVYCHETGGDAIQRMWIVKGDGSGNRPLFEEGPTDWVTHEIVIGRDEVLFNLIGFQDRLRKNPTGIAVINLRTDFVNILGQIEEDVPEGMLGAGGPGGYWHCNGSPDGRWAAGDTFRGDLWLIDRKSGKQILLSTGHHMSPDHLHPSFSPDSNRIVIQSGHLSGGKSLDVMVITIPHHLR